MTTLDFSPRRSLPLPAIRQPHARLVRFREAATSILLIIAFVAIAFVGFYLRARMALPH